MRIRETHRPFYSRSVPCPHTADDVCTCSPVLQDTLDSLQLFTEGDDLYQAMLADLESAQQRIQLESYIFADDEIGRQFSAMLIERARAGVDVQVHLDAAGSLFLASRQLVRDLRKHGIRLHRFHRWSWRKPLRYNRRDHRKLLVVDGRKAYVGGFNIHRESSKAVFGMERWRDTHVRFEGLLAMQAAQIFDRFWQGDLRWVPGLGTIDEVSESIAEVLGVTTRTVQRDWMRARAWLKEELGSAPEAPEA